jgi:hypothetical protein
VKISVFLEPAAMVRDLNTNERRELFMEALGGMLGKFSWGEIAAAVGEVLTDAERADLAAAVTAWRDPRDEAPPPAPDGAGS